MSKNKSITRYIAVLFAAVLVVIDQAIKYRMVELLDREGRIKVARNFFYLTYVENRGAAFGIFQGKTGMLALLTGIVLAAVLVLILAGRIHSNLLMWSLSLVLAGGVGNLIDRVSRGFVVDYLDFSALFGFPVFNFADCCVVVGTILLLCCVVWNDRAAKKDVPAGPADPTGTEA